MDGQEGRIMFLVGCLADLIQPGALSPEGEAEAVAAWEGFHALLDEADSEDVLIIDEADPRWIAAEHAVFGEDPVSYPERVASPPPPPPPKRGTPEYWANFFGYRLD